MPVKNSTGCSPFTQHFEPAQSYQAKTTSSVMDIGGCIEHKIWQLWWNNGYRLLIFIR